jgi:ABC-type methionine transport system permease subunit
MRLIGEIAWIVMNVIAVCACPFIAPIVFANLSDVDDE